MFTPRLSSVSSGPEIQPSNNQVFPASQQRQGAKIQCAGWIGEVDRGLGVGGNWGGGMGGSDVFPYAAGPMESGFSTE